MQGGDALRSAGVRHRDVRVAVEVSGGAEGGGDAVRAGDDDGGFENAVGEQEDVREAEGEDGREQEGGAGGEDAARDEPVRRDGDGVEVRDRAHVARGRGVEGGGDDVGAGRGAVGVVAHAEVLPAAEAEGGERAGERAAGDGGGGVVGEAALVGDVDVDLEGVEVAGEGEGAGEV